MGQQSSRHPNNIYFHKKLPSFLFRKSHRTTQTPKPEQPIKFLYKTSKKSENKPKKAKNTDNFGFQTLNNLKNALGSVNNANETKEGNNVKETKTVVRGTATRPTHVDSSTFNQNNGELDVNGARNQIKEAKLYNKEAWDNAKISKESRKTKNFKDFIFAERQSEQNIKNTKRDTKDCRKDVNKPNVPLRTKSEPNLGGERGRERHRHRRKGGKLKGGNEGKVQQFGYEIQDVDGFLAKATLDKPANIPVVLAFPSVLYRTRVGGYQAEISLPLGMVVNAIFKNQNWLYVQTPHAEEGYVSYYACLPLGIIPPPEDDQHSPCWEKSTDIFPKPSGNMTDTEKLSCKSECGNEEETYCASSRYRTAHSTCGEKSVDRLYLRAAAIAKGKGTRHTLLVINEEYNGIGTGALSVLKNEVVFLLSTKIKGWFYVKNKEGQEGFIPSVVAGHGFL